MNDSYTKALNCMLATTRMDAVTPDDVAYTLAGHSAFESVGYPSPAERTVDVTRVDGEIMRVILDYDPETCEPAGWTTAQGPSVDELQSEDGGASDGPEQVIRDLHAAILDWLDQCDMSDDQIEWLADDLDAEDYYSLSQERDDNGNTYLVIDHENDHGTSIAWDRKKRAFVCEELLPNGGGGEYTATNVDEIITKLDAQARL